MKYLSVVGQRAHEAVRIIRPKKTYYQDKVNRSKLDRWNLMRGSIPDDSGTLLDVGCDLGYYTAKGADNGLWSIGIDRSEKAIRLAQQKHRMTRCAYMVMDVTPGDIVRLPAFDVVLLLSVHHHWVRAYGPAVATRMLQEFGQKTSKVMFFEGPSRKKRYGESPPVAFVDNDELTVREYYGGFLSDSMGDQFRGIEFLGKNDCVGQREPFRLMFLLRK